MDRRESCFAPRRRTFFAEDFLYMEKEFTIAIVGGTGSMGTALALRLAAPGVRVIIGSRGREKDKSVADAVKDAEFVVIAVPYEGHAKIIADLKGQLGGKTLIDAVVPLQKGRPFLPP